MLTRTLESLEALQWDSGGAGDKLQQPGPPLLVKRLHGFPEPLDDVAVQGAVLQAGVGLPVSDVDLSQAAHDELEVEREMETSLRPHETRACIFSETY